MPEENTETIVEPSINDIFSDETTVDSGVIDSGGSGNEQKPDEVTESIDPTPDSFVESTQQAFMSDGELSSETLNSFVSAEAPSIPDSDIDVANDNDDTIDPEATYKTSVMELTNDLPALFAKDKEDGYTAEETLTRLLEALDEYSETKDSSTKENARFAGIEKRIDGKLNQAHEAKIDARIESITSKMGERYNDVVPGLTGQEVLTQLVLHPKFGGEFVVDQFNKENPKFSGLPEAQQATVKARWFKEFQADSKNMRRAEKIGRAEFLLQRIPNLIQNGIKIGAKKATAQNYTVGGKPQPNVKSQTAPNEGDVLNAIFGASN